MNNLIWKEISRTKKANCIIFNWLQLKMESPDGRLADFTILDCPDWVNIVAETKNEQGQDCYIMVKQFRHGSGKVTIEFPAGVIEKDETPNHAAARELIEETGYIADELIEAGDVNPNPAFLNNRCYTYAAFGLQKIANLKLDANEYLEPLLIPVKDVELEIGKGNYDNGVMVSAILFYQNLKKLKNITF